MICHNRGLLPAFDEGGIIDFAALAFIGLGQGHNLGRGSVHRPGQHRARRCLQSFPDAGRYCRLALVAHCAGKHDLKILYPAPCVKARHRLPETTIVSDLMAHQIQIARPGGSADPASVLGYFRDRLAAAYCNAFTASTNLDQGGSGVR